VFGSKSILCGFSPRGIHDLLNLGEAASPPSLARMGGGGVQGKNGEVELRREKGSVQV
jgi:hypothetical protein